MIEKAFYYWLYQISGIGKVKRKLLLDKLKTAEAVFYAEEKEYANIVGIKEQDRVLLKQAKRNLGREEILYEYDKLKEQGIKFFTPFEKEFPEKLKEIYNSPDGLFVKGKLPDSKKTSIAIVGARNCSEYGKDMAEWFGKELAQAGIQIISGLARGIDGYAHIGAINTGETYGVLGCGLDTCYPKEHISIFMEMQRCGGILSEYAVGTKPKAGNFPLRNRIISGLSDGILVVEAKKKSGSLITAELGLEQGKDIFSIPGRNWDTLSEGCNSLIKQGAFLVTKPEDIIDYYCIKIKKNSLILKKNEKFLDLKQKMVYSCLSFKPKHVSIIIEETQLPFWEVTKALIELQLENIIREVGNNFFAIDRD